MSESFNKSRGENSDFIINENQPETDKSEMTEDARKALELYQNFYKVFENDRDGEQSEILFSRFLLQLKKIVDPKHTESRYEGWTSEELDHLHEEFRYFKKDNMIPFHSGTAGERIFFFDSLHLNEDEDPKNFGLGDEGITYDEKRREIKALDYNKAFMKYPNPVKGAGYESQLRFWESFVGNFGNEQVYLLRKLVT